MAASSSSHGPDIGENREVIVREFLEKHLPKRLSVSLGGQIIGIDGSVSNQIDIIVNSDIAMRFEQNRKTFISTEGVASAITVKSYLNKGGLIDCLKNIASIPQADVDVLRFPFSPNMLFYKYIKIYPAIFVFAYTGIKLKTCLNHLQEFYQEHKDIPVNRYPCGILVNKKYYIRYTRFESKTTTGEIIPAGRFCPVTLSEDICGYPFFDILTHISTHTSWLSQMNINFSPYFNKCF